MSYLTAGLIAALGSWVVNRNLIKWEGNKVIISLLPIVEEVFKTGTAVSLGSSIILTHMIFGAVEGLYDLRTRGGGVPAALVSLAGHWLFGYMTTTGSRLTGSLAGGMLLGIGAHLFWNRLVYKLSIRNRL
ncbi:MAG: hypothetical protein ACYC2T_03580 [Bacillota bacterium]